MLNSRRKWNILCSERKGERARSRFANTPNKPNLNGKKCVSIFYAGLNRKLSTWPKSEDDFHPTYDSALTDQEVCFPFRL